MSLSLLFSLGSSWGLWGCIMSFFPSSSGCVKPSSAEWEDAFSVSLLLYVNTAFCVYPSNKSTYCSTRGSRCTHYCTADSGVRAILWISLVRFQVFSVCTAVSAPLSPSLRCLQWKTKEKKRVHITTNSQVFRKKRDIIFVLFPSCNLCWVLVFLFHTSFPIPHVGPTSH